MRPLSAFNLSALNPRDKVLVLGGVSYPLPAIVGTILALMAGAVQVINVDLPLSQAWHSYILIGDVFFAGVGITSVTGPAFRAALKLPDWAANLISAALAALILALNTIQMDQVVKTTIATVVTVAAGLGFEPVSSAVTTAGRVAKDA